MLSTTTFITIAIAALMVSATQASEFEERANTFGDPVVSNSAFQNHVNNPNSFYPRNKRDVTVIGLPGSGTSAGKMVTSGSSGGFYNKRAGVKVYPKRKRALPLVDASGSVTSGGFGTMRVDQSATIAKRGCDKAKPEPKKVVAAAKPCNDKHRKRTVPIVDNLLHGIQPKVTSSKNSHVRRSGAKAHSEPKKADGAKPCKDNGSHGKRELPIVSPLLNNVAPKKVAPKGIRVKRAGVKVHPSRLTMRKRDLVSNSPILNVNAAVVPVVANTHSDHAQYVTPFSGTYNPTGEPRKSKRNAPTDCTPSGQYPDTAKTVGKDIIVIKDCGGKA
ncbi:hypothetical protein INT47_002949 [Mucor saturninus]|uniref:Uncharacterized protein n=1 Tax=Mucor saturninus TaxID=64648 RepID=A0A8H7URJ0_9FUNG|nr:hypothetical protein INT47_002949 [Mucor saturninus]